MISVKMQFKLLLFCFCWVISLSVCERHSVSINTGNIKDEEDFIPSEEWKEVLPGQKIPPGLHVQMDLQTGKTQAKFLGDPDKSNLPTLAVEAKDNDKEIVGDTSADKNKNDDESKPHFYIKQQLEEALKKIKPEQHSEDSAEDLKRFRKYEDIKKDFEKINVHIKTDLEIIKGLLKKWNETKIAEANKQKTDTEVMDTKLSILDDLEYYLHQIDNSENFGTMFGLELLRTELNVSNWVANDAAQVQNSALLVLAAAVQANIKMQIRALELGYVPLLLKIFEQGPNHLKNRVVTAISSLTRNFAYSQLVFFRSGGLMSFRSAFTKEPLDWKLQMKVITLLTDFITEQEQSVTGDAERAKQYSEVNTRSLLLESGWCAYFPQLLELGDHDSVEKTVVAMSKLAEGCHTYFKPSLSTLQTLKSHYNNLADEELRSEGSAGFFASLHRNIQNLVVNLSKKEEL